MADETNEPGFVSILLYLLMISNISAICAVFRTTLFSASQSITKTCLKLCFVLTRRYFCSDACSQLAHFALGIPIYTHFTSPIRRYPDIMVHRLLAASIGVAAKPLRAPESLQAIANRCNEQKYNAKLAGESSTDVYFIHYVKKRGEVQMRAVILEVINTDNFEIMLLDTGMKFKIGVSVSVLKL